MTETKTPKGSTYKRCGCRDETTNKVLGQACPLLRRADGNWHPSHGQWSYQIELPPTENNTRRTLRQSGFATKDDAENELDQVRALLAVAEGNRGVAIRIGTALKDTVKTGEALPTPQDLRRRVSAGIPLGHLPTVTEYLTEWIAQRRGITEGTAQVYGGHIRNHLIPHLGHLRLDFLRGAHIAAMFDTIEEVNAYLRQIRDTGTQDEKAAIRGRRITGPATKHRIRATLRKALNDAIRDELLTLNPAKYVELPSGKRPKAVLWTAERVIKWRKTGQLPSPVMVWTAAQVGAFLDHTEEHDELLYPLFHLIAHSGPRRGEACGLRIEDLDLNGSTATITQQIIELSGYLKITTPKSDAGDRIIALDAGTLDVLRIHLRRQKERRLAAGPRWIDTGLLFTRPDGRALCPSHVTDRFIDLSEHAGLPPIKLHGLRHSAATIALAAGTDIKVVQVMLGHASSTLTSDTYTSVLPELARAAAENSAAFIPRQRHTQAS